MAKAPINIIDELEQNRVSSLILTPQAPEIPEVTQSFDISGLPIQLSIPPTASQTIESNQPVSKLLGTTTDPLRQIISDAGNELQQQSEIIRLINESGQELMDPIVKADKTVQQYIADVFGNIMEIGGATGGAFLGSRVGQPALGAGLGFGLGRSGARGLRELFGVPNEEFKSLTDSLLRSAFDVGTGASFEAVTPLIGKLAANVAGKVAAFVKRQFPTITNDTIKNYVAEQVRTLINNIKRTPIFIKNLERAEELTQAIPDLKLTFGQATNMPSAIVKEQAIARGVTNIGDTLAVRQAKNMEAIQRFIDQEFTGKPLETVKALKENTDNIKAKFDNLVEALNPEKVTEFGIGKKIFDNLLARKKADRLRVEELFNQHSNTVVDTKTLVDDVVNFTKQFNNRALQAKEIPTKEIEHILNNIQIVTQNGEKIPFTTLIKINDLVKGLRDSIALAGSQFNSTKQHFLIQLKDILKKFRDEIPNPELDAARLASAEKKQKFNQGIVSDILRPTIQEPTGFRFENIPKQFFNQSGAKAYVNVFGKNDPDIQQTFAQHLLARSIDPITKTINPKILIETINKNQTVLKELGIETQFNNLEMVAQSLNNAVKGLDQFNKTITGSLLEDINIDRAIETIFTTNNINSLLRRIRAVKDQLAPNKAAIEGLHRAYVDFLIKKSNLKSLDIAQNPLVSLSSVVNTTKSFDPVTKLIFNDSPEKIKALEIVRDAYINIARNRQHVLGPGSQTVEFANALFSRLQRVTDTSPSFLIRASSRLLQILNRISTKDAQQTINEFWGRVLLDPDYAFAIVHMLRQPDTSMHISFLLAKQGAIPFLPEFDKSTTNR